MSERSLGDLIGAVRRRARVRTRWHRTTTRIAQQRRSTAYARARSAPIDERTVLYEAFFGNGVLDNPAAVFRHLLTQPDLAHLRHVWVLDDPRRHEDVRRELAGHPRVSFVKADSPAYFRALGTAKYLVNNQTFPQLFAKRPEQVYLNTWHGVPLKHMGFDVTSAGKAHPRNVVRNLLNADYLVSASPFMTDTMYRRAFKLEGLYPGTVLEMGQPRMDVLRQALDDPASARRVLEAAGVAVGERRILLFAPTWRGNDFGHPEDDAAALATTCARLQQALDPRGFVVLLKVHQAAYDLVREALGERGTYLVPHHVDTNVVLGASDLLVTDYSSIFFDYLATGRPVVHYVPDLEDYTSERGLYLAPDDLPGPQVTDLPGLVAAVEEAVDAGPVSERARRAGETYTGPADGEVTARIVDVVFRGREEAASGPGRRLVRDFVDPRKERMLIYMGSMLSQGITTSAINLLRHLDYDKYDVTVFWPQIRGRDRAKNVALVHDRARPLPRALTYVGTRRQIARETEVLTQVGLPAELDRNHLDFWRTEYQRAFGNASFDHLIDFSGYGCYAPFLYSAVDAEHRSIWLHAEMMADRNRETLGVQHLHARLSAVFSTYRLFDNLVSVSPELRDINRSGLAEYAPADRFRYALNTIDGELILRLSEELFWGDAVFGTPEEFAARLARGEVRVDGVTPVSSPAAQARPEGAAESASSEEGPDDRNDPETGEDPEESTEELEHAESLESAGTVDEVGEVAREEAEPTGDAAAQGGRSQGGYVNGRPHRLRPVREPGTTLFITVGRLSPEKNHARLLDAFARVHERHPDIRLWLIGGGPLEQSLRNQVERLGLGDVVHMTGQVMNPYKFLRKADCFVLSSEYEGQPIVILEARVLGLPVVSTAFATVGDSIPAGAGIVVPRSVEGVAEGLERFLAGEVEGSVLDHEEYNREAVRQFEAAIHAGGEQRGD